MSDVSRVTSPECLADTTDLVAVGVVIRLERVDAIAGPHRRCERTGIALRVERHADHLSRAVGMREREPQRPAGARHHAGDRDAPLRGER
jgi:hypothetical protein